MQWAANSVIIRLVAYQYFPKHSAFIGKEELSKYQAF